MLPKTCAQTSVWHKLQPSGYQAVSIPQPLQAQIQIPAVQSPDTFTVVPAALSLKHTAVRGLPKAIVAGVPTDFTIHPTDQYGNRGAQGTDDWFCTLDSPVLQAALHITTIMVEPIGVHWLCWLLYSPHACQFSP